MLAAASTSTPCGVPRTRVASLFHFFTPPIPMYVSEFLFPSSIRQACPLRSLFSVQRQQLLLNLYLLEIEHEKFPASIAPHRRLAVCSIRCLRRRRHCGEAGNRRWRRLCASSILKRGRSEAHGARGGREAGRGLGRCSISAVWLIGKM